jgi:hypothetical protein
MSSSEDSEPIESSSSVDEQEEQHGGDQQVTGATADPQVLQLFWDLASLEQVGTRFDPTAAVQCVAWHIQPLSERTDRLITCLLRFMFVKADVCGYRWA